MPLLAFAQEGDRREIDLSRPPPEWDIPEAPVLSPEEALESFHLQPGFRLELVASEPLLHDPVAIAFDEDGRIWVVEMRSYMPNVDGEDEIEPVSRVVVLEDTVGDGRMDTSTVWMDGLILPRAIQVVAGGVLVAEPPYLWFTRDTTGDGRADEKTMVTDNYSHRQENPERGGNGLMYGIDNWIHSVNYPGGRFRYFDGEWVNEPALMRGQWGLSQDDYGRHFSNSNSDHLRADHVPSHYYTRNSNFASRGARDSMGGVYHRIGHNQETFPGRITPGVNRRDQLRDDGTLARFTAVCWPVIYRGDRYPEEYRGNAFIPEPAAHFIRRSILKEDEDGVLTAENAYEGQEFLWSEDERFRPVSMYNGPDGTLYIVDMYRGILQHRQFVTTYLRQQIEERGLEEPLGLGRIYRIVHESAEPLRPPRMSEQTSAELVEHLSNPNSWWRETAQRVLIERQDHSVVSALRSLAVGEDSSEVSRIHALWTLEGLNAIDPAVVASALRDESRWVRVTACRVSETLLREGDDRTFRRVADLSTDREAVVRLQAALSLGEYDSEEIEEVFATLLSNDRSHPFLSDAVLSGLEGRELEFLIRLVSDVQWMEPCDDRERILTDFSSAVMREGESSRVRKLFDLAVDSAPWQTVAILQGIDNSRVRALDEEPRQLSILAASDDPVVRRQAARLADHLQWPDPAGLGEAPRELSEAQRALFARGERAYQINCATCHHPDGGGVPGLAAPLVDSQWVLGDQDHLIRVVLQGKVGDDDMLMPPMGSALSDNDVAAILTYIRRAWGHDADPVSLDAVRDVRAATMGRREPWTAGELERLSGEE